MQIKRGIPVSPGVAIGPAMVLGTENFRIPQRFVTASAVEFELTRFPHSARSGLRRDFAQCQPGSRAVGRPARRDLLGSFDARPDPKLIEQIEKRIQDMQSPEFAVSRVLGHYAKPAESGRPILAERQRTSSISKSGSCGIFWVSAARNWLI